jgi:cytochrome c553
MLALAAGMIAGCSAPVVAPALRTGEEIAFGGGPGGPADACFTCHGFEGEGDGAAPRLAGQSNGYLVKQMEDYSRRWRNHAQMSAIASRLAHGDRVAVSAYYASLGDFSSRPGRPAVGGPRLFLDGDPDRGLPPCAQCHGRQGEGGGLANPVLAGQPAKYVSAQLRALKASERRNDPQDVMGAVARRLTEEEIDSLAGYVEALR